MNCTHFEKQVWDYLEGRLSASERAAFEAHRAHCEHCQRVWESAQHTVQALRRLPRYRPAPDFRERLQARLQQASPKPARPRLRLGWKPLALAPALGLLIAFFWFHNEPQKSLTNLPPDAVGTDDYTEMCVQLHETLETAEWSPTPAASYWVNTGYTR